jgi:bacillithiol biosynthesis deacetylase BshB1
MQAIDAIDVLAVGAHPDDVEFFAAGTLLGMAARGQRTAIVDLTRGEMSTRGSAQERGDEAREAAKVLGLAHRENLDMGDGGLRDTPGNRAALVAVLRRMRPRLVLTHFPGQPHPDHAAATALVQAAVYLAGLAKWAAPGGHVRHRPAAIVYFGLPASQPPSFIVDISRFAAQKDAAVRCHRSQLFDPESVESESAVCAAGFLGRLEVRHRGYGERIGVEFGEAFWVREALAIEDPLAHFPGPFDILP